MRLQQRNRNRYIGLVKDIAAGGVLLAAVAALLVGVIVLARPELWELFRGMAQSPWQLGGPGLVPGRGGGFCPLGTCWAAERLDSLRRKK